VRKLGFALCENTRARANREAREAGATKWV
jgi:hypothetical protein